MLSVVLHTPQCLPSRAEGSDKGEERSELLLNYSVPTPQAPGWGMVRIPCLLE